MPADSVEQLASAVQQLASAIDGIRPDQWSLATPCPEWDVRALVRHLVAGQLVFARALGATDADPAGVDDDAARLPEAFRASGALMLDGFRRPGVLDEVVDIPVGRVPGAVAVHVRITECLAHGWDLARATGRPVEFDERVVEQEIEFTRGALALIPADRTPFAPEQPVAPDAGAIDRLAALVGRAIT